MTLDINASHAVPVTFGGKVVKAIPQKDGTYLQLGNTNGNLVDSTAWLYHAIMDGAAKASPAWGASSQLHTWYSSQHYGASFVNHWLPIAIQAATEVAVAYGFAAAAGAGADASTVADESVPQATFTGQLAQPIVEVDTGLTTETIAPLTLTGVAEAGATAATVGDEVLGAVGKTAIKGAAALGAAEIAAGAKPAADVVSSNAAGADAGAGAGGTDWKKLIIYGVGLLAAALAFT